MNLTKGFTNFDNVASAAYPVGTVPSDRLLLLITSGASMGAIAGWNISNSEVNWGSPPNRFTRVYSRVAGVETSVNFGFAGADGILLDMFPADITVIGTPSEVNGSPNPIPSLTVTDTSTQVTELFAQDGNTIVAPPVGWTAISTFFTARPAGYLAAYQNVVALGPTGVVNQALSSGSRSVGVLSQITTALPFGGAQILWEG